MELEIKTTKPSQIIWKAELFSQSSLESKFSFSSSVDVVNEGIWSRYQKFRESIVNLGIYRIHRPKYEMKDENQDDEEHKNRCKKIIGSENSMGVSGSISNKILSDGVCNIAPQVFETSITDGGITQEQVDQDRVIAGGYCRGIRDHDEQDDEEQKIMGVVEKPSRLKNLLYLILTVSSLILCFLPRVYGDKIPNLFLPCPWLFYGFNFALMLAAAASLVSIDTVSNFKKVTRCFSDLAILSILTALALFLFSSFLWAI